MRYDFPCLFSSSIAFIEKLIQNPGNSEKGYICIYMLTQFWWECKLLQIFLGNSLANLYQEIKKCSYFLSSNFTSENLSSGNKPSCENSFMCKDGWYKLFTVVKVWNNLSGYIKIMFKSYSSLGPTKILPINAAFFIN